MRIQGQIHHRIGPLEAKDDDKLICAQVYFKGENECEARQKYTSELNPFVIMQLQAMLTDDCMNPFIMQFKKAAQIAKSIDID